MVACATFTKFWHIIRRKLSWGGCGTSVSCNVCQPHLCIFGSTVDANGYYGPSFQRGSSRFPRHHALNGIIRRVLISANVPCTLEPPGLGW
ncbi:hypothetical protein EVAR_17456_1 [Eumeta japonica]|uniref:Uncharacterized protein n=1 Tax=Eumeta variegata TaxID=151549 RepID=A0A4C1VCC0_EUMVA|nr:hypothetical protein EVAR_17456_1 [Eumeta japonica]